MRKLAITTLLLLSAATLFAQQPSPADSTTFCGLYINKEYDLHIRLNAYRSNVMVPGQELFGPLPGFLGDNQDARKWLFTSAKVSDAKTVTLQVINDYGSEDLEATFVLRPDSTYEFRQGAGSTVKIARNRKWVKLPKTLVFTRKDTKP